MMRNALLTSAGGTGLYFAPTAGEAFLLALIGSREGGAHDYVALNPTSTASGLYQFINGTWGDVCKVTGVGLGYPRAYLAPPVDQDYNALYVLRKYGPNSSYTWKASGPYPTLAECVFAIQYA